MRKPLGSKKKVTLLRAARLIQKRPVARNLCAGFWSPQRTPTKAVLRASFLGYYFYKIRVHTWVPYEPTAVSYYRDRDFDGWR